MLCDKGNRPLSAHYSSLRVIYVFNMNFISSGSCNTIPHTPSDSHTHTHTESHIQWRHMSYVHAEIDRYNCMHMQSCSSSLIWRHLGVKDFFQSKSALTRGTSSSSVRKNNLQIIWIKSERSAWTSGSRLRVSFLSLCNFFSHYSHEKIISGELNLCQRGSGK